LSDFLIIFLILLFIVNGILFHLYTEWKHTANLQKDNYKDLLNLFEEYINKSDSERVKEAKTLLSNLRRENSTLKYKYRELIKIIDSFNNANEVKINVDSHLLPDYEYNKIMTKIKSTRNELKA